jgi:hypothetical protein
MTGSPSPTSMIVSMPRCRNVGGDRVDDVRGAGVGRFRAGTVTDRSNLAWAAASRTACSWRLLSTNR